MLKLYRYWFAAVLTLFLVACGGGGNLDNGNGITNDSEYQLTLSAVNSAGTSANITSNADPLTVSATLMSEGQPAESQIITFATTNGVLVPASGIVVTDSQGVAQVTLKPGTELTGDTLVATFSSENGDITKTLNYTSKGDGQDVTQDPYTITTSTYLCNSSNLTTVADITAQCTQSNLISQAMPLYVVVNVFSNTTQAVVTDQLVSATVGTGVLLPENGNAILDAQGNAIFKLFSDGGTGSDQLTVTYDQQTHNQVYQITTTEVTPTHGYRLTADLTNVNGTTITNIAKDTPGVVQATLTLDGNPVAREIIQITTDVGVLRPATGSVLTDVNGVAQLVIGAGNIESSGTLTISSDIQNGSQTIELEETLNFATAGDDIEQAPSSFTLSVNLFASDEVTQTTHISEANSGVLEATLLGSDGTGLANQVVSFESTLGQVFPSLGTALTDADGKAKVELTAGEVKGAGTATVTYQDATAQVSFTSEGDANIENEEFDISIQLFNCNGIESPVPPFNNCTENRNLSLTNPAKALVRVTRQGSTDPIVNTLITASVDAGSLSPSNGRVITDENGYAVLTLLAGEDDGAGQLTIESVNSSKSTVFTINTVNIAMGNGEGENFVEGVIKSDLNGGELAVGNTTILTLNIVDQDNNNALYTDSVDITLTSACASETPAKAFIDQSVTAINGMATAIYRADGCRGTDRINATASAGTSSLSSTLSIKIAEVPTSYIKFVSAAVDGDTEARIITYPGTGRTEQADVVFQVLDENNNPKASENMKFSVTAEGAGIKVTPTTAKTDSNGLVTLAVSAGRTPTPVRVIAEAVDENGNSYQPKIQATSDLLTVSTGLPDQNSFSLAATEYNIEAWDYIGDTVDITTFLSDHFNNPVPNGTAVSFITSHGQIQDSCITTNGQCSVEYTVTQAKPGKETDPDKMSRVDAISVGLANGMCDVGNDNDPANDTDAAAGLPCFGIENTATGALGPLQLTGYKKGRLSILAYAVGEESFVDANANGKYDTGEYFGDMAEAFLDWNEDNLFCGRLADGSASPGAEATVNPVTPEADATPDGTCLPGGDDEEFIDFGGTANGTLDVANQTYDKGDSKFNGILCELDDDSCNQNFIHVRRDITMILSGSNAVFRVIDSATESDLTLIDLVNNASVSLTAYITDINGNPMPVGTTVSITTDNGTIQGTSGYEFVNSTSSIPTGFSFTLGQETQVNSVSEGIATITVTTPKGISQSISIPVIDAG
ncbi:Ig-like domain-containing protein [Catenovulum sediminis]|uniref:Ig-like domain-containing protein n=1 Tax=Catenovulum sediminis TaxID=1740262 RepID=A0ABV1RK00_9ALTE